MILHIVYFIDLRKYSLKIQKNKEISIVKFFNITEKRISNLINKYTLIILCFT